ncbi:glycosyltransferase family 10 domain-containing protein [Aestuariicoccus sp. MJ-SS9]|uniref:glycosyltransferase family 10 domain-containing protein n=1 Tax=Aestuariicoccus sp. MJ-SS9 TaxID=3079855 RepID=UPI002909A072|nr:glycosyltransferase family 10 [Aestuariicoccus sp. MJ-SS9]MDU8914024.1 glycosyltransferase family 10 [Aestuariicoccus sp. MJ-SS9]
MIRIHIAGDYGHRQPLAYAPIQALTAGALELTDDPGAADLVLIAHPRDLDTHGDALRAGLGAHQRLVLFSEEPFWDTIWGGDPFRRDQIHDTARGPLPYTWLNHFTSPVFAFDRIPYFLLTDRSYFNRYALRFAQNAARGAAHWQAHFDRSRDIVFMAEKRRNEKFDRAFEGHDVFGLSARRTRIALACIEAGLDVTCRGHGWEGNVQRSDLRDWHMEKLLELDGAVRVLSAIENTHAAPYVTEKLFDAFAVGGWPLYIAGPDHRVRDLVPEGSWLNLYGLSPEDAAAAVAALTPDPAAYAEAQARLAALFTIRNLVSEQERLHAALLAELPALCEQSPTLV